MSKAKYSIDLIKQMAECDANYIRLLKLVPQLSIYRDITLSKYDNREKEYGLVRKRNSSNVIKDNENNSDEVKVEFTISDLINSNQRIMVQIKILENFKYTNTLEIIQKPELKKWITNPSMIVRVYHDASTAEVISSQGHKNFQSRYPEINSMMYQSDEKMRVNAFLGEWLTYCLKFGKSVEAPELIFKN
jgi:hypothetical protein